MNQPLQLEVLSELVELLVECADPRARERILVKALWERNWAQSVALFRALPREADRTAWTESIAMGPADLLPDGEVVRAVHCGELSAELPLNKRIVFGANSHTRSALVLGGFGGEEHELDLLEATFQVLSAVAEADSPTARRDPSLLDLVHGALPAERDPRAGDHPATAELGRLLEHIGGTELLLGGGLGPLADEDKDHFGQVLDDTCARAAGLFGNALEDASRELGPNGDTRVATRLEDLCRQGARILAQRDIELKLHSNPSARRFTLPVAQGAVDSLLEELLGRLFERLRRLRAGGGRVDIDLELGDERELTLRVWTQSRRGRELIYSPGANVPEELLRAACARRVPQPQGQPGACLEVRFQHPTPCSP